VIRRLLFGFALTGPLACGRAESASLREPDSQSCTADAYLLALPASGGFVLNSELRDSAALSGWLRNVLPRRTGTGRNVNVVAAQSRQRELDWLVPAIRRAGGEAFALDRACRIAIPNLTPAR
jgi:hypothetical protein